MKNLDGQISVQGETFDVKGTVTCDGCFVWMTDSQPREMLQKMEVGSHDAFTHHEYPNGFPFIAVPRSDITRVLNDIDKHIDASEYGDDVAFFRKVADDNEENPLAGSLAFEWMYDFTTGLVYDSDGAEHGHEEANRKKFFLL